MLIRTGGCESSVLFDNTRRRNQAFGGSGNFNQGRGLTDLMSALCHKRTCNLSCANFVQKTGDLCLYSTAEVVRPDFENIGMKEAAN